jgi:hypothetical protein
MCQSTAPRGTAARHHCSGAAALRAAAVTVSRFHLHTSREGLWQAFAAQACSKTQQGCSSPSTAPVAWSNDFGANLFGAHRSLRLPRGDEKSRGSGHRSQGTPALHEQGRLVAGICCAGKFQNSAGMFKPQYCSSRVVKHRAACSLGPTMCGRHPLPPAQLQIRGTIPRAPHVLPDVPPA